jgi:hypothetical protein
MNPRLIATQGLGGRARLIAVLGLAPSSALARPSLPSPATDPIGGSGSFARYMVDDDTYEIPLYLANSEDEEAVVLTLLMELSLVL